MNRLVGSAATTFALLLLIGETRVALAAEPTAESATSANGAGTNALRYSNKWRIEVGEGAQIQTARSSFASPSKAPSLRTCASQSATGRARTGLPARSSARSE